MARKPIDGLTDHELKIMRVLWRSAPLTVQELLDRFPRTPKPAYTSLLTAVQALERKGFLRHESKGRAYLYAPTVDAAAFRKSALRKFVDNVFGGDAFGLAVSLVEREELSKDEIASLRKLLEEL